MMDFAFIFRKIYLENDSKEWIIYKGGGE